MALQDSRPLSRGAKVLGLLLVALIFALVLVLLIVVSPPAILERTEGEAHVRFLADRSSVFMAGDCVHVQWEVGGIQTVHINDQPTVGTGEREVCVIPEVIPLLRVRLQNGTEREYPLPITIVVRTPVFWIVAAFTMIMFLWAGGVLIHPAAGRLLSPVRPYALVAIRALEILVLLLLVGGIVGEVSLRLYFTHFGTQLERIRYVYTADEIKRQVASLIPMPYVSFVASPHFPGHNRLGYRGPEFEVRKPPGMFRIVALGGSTTYSSSTNAEQAYPAQLQRILQDEYGFSNVEVINAGVSGYTSWDMLVNYMFRVTELEPDLLIIYEGINDVQPRAVVPECYRGNNALRGLNPTRRLWSGAEIPSSSVLYRAIAIELGWMPDPSTLEGTFSTLPYRCEGDFLDNERIQNNRPAYFARNMRDIVILAQANDTQVMFSTWTYNPNGDVGAIPPEYQAAVAEHNDIIRELAAEYELPLYDLAVTDFWQNSSHWANPDPIHMSPSGTLEQASRYAAYLVEQGLIPDRSS